MSIGIKNYITPAGYRRLRDELARLWKVDRPAMVATVSPALRRDVGAIIAEERHHRRCLDHILRTEADGV